MTALRHPTWPASCRVVDVGGVFGTMYLAMNYILPVIAATLVAACPPWWNCRNGTTT